MMIKTLSEMWERNEYLYSAYPAILYEGKKTSFGELVTRARQLADALYALDVRRQDRVAMLALNCSQWFDYYVACEMHGFIAQTVNFRLTGPEIEFVLNDATPQVLIFQAQYADLVDSIRPNLKSVRHFICIGDGPDWALRFDDVLASGSVQGPPIRAEESDGVHLIYTSGTTGRPKGVLRDQAGGFQSAASIAVSQNMKVNGSIIIAMPLFHIGAQAQSSGQHLAGGMVAVQSKFDPGEIANVVEAEKIQFTHMAPTMVRMFLEHPDIVGRDLSSLKTIVYAAAPMPVDLLRTGMARLGSVFLNCYGATECGNVSVLQQHLHKAEGPPHEVARLPSVGQEHLYSRLRVVDDDDVECPRGTPGELCVQSASMMTGYWNNDAATVEALRGGWYHTGDIARMDEEGFVFLIDRKKDMIISGGENIYCREVEEALMTNPAIDDVAVIGVPDEKWGEAVMAVVVLKPDMQTTIDEIVAQSRDHLASYKRPRHVQFVESLPRLNTGKVNKVILRETYRTLS
jgi:acyl-CoA synthetase (AMP-forming)/AMP-acid ligase II